MAIQFEQYTRVLVASSTARTISFRKVSSVPALLLGTLAPSPALCLGEELIGEK
jgi:hypothetical protein